MEIGGLNCNRGGFLEEEDESFFFVVREKNSLRELRLDSFSLEELGMYAVFSSSLIIH